MTKSVSDNWECFLISFGFRRNKKIKQDECVNEPKTNMADVSNLANVLVHPNVLKRTCRLSPGKDLIGVMPGQKSKHAFIVAPQCVGSDLISVLWVNDLFLWIWNDLFLIQELIQIWIRNLNLIMSKLINEVLFKDQKHRPFSKIKLQEIGLIFINGFVPIFLLYFIGF